MSRTIDVEVIETITVKKTVKVTIPESPDFDPEDDEAICEIENIARKLAYQDLAITPESTWELISSDGPDFNMDWTEVQVDYSKMTVDDEVRILGKLLSVYEIVDTGDVESIMREELNNDVISRMESDGTTFEEAFEEIISEMTSEQLLSYPGVFNEVREEHHNQILETWEQENDL